MRHYSPVPIDRLAQAPFTHLIQQRLCVIFNLQPFGTTTSAAFNSLLVNKTSDKRCDINTSIRPTRSLRYQHHWWHAVQSLSPIPALSSLCCCWRRVSITYSNLLQHSDVRLRWHSIDIAIHSLLLRTNQCWDAPIPVQLFASLQLAPRFESVTSSRRAALSTFHRY